MSAVLLWATSYVVNAAWQLPLLAAAGWGLSRWVKPVGPELQHKVWVAVLLLATLTPATPLVQPNFTLDLAVDTTNVSLPLMMPAAARPASSDSFRVLLPASAIYVVCGLYLASLVFFGGRLWRGIVATKSLVREAVPTPLEPEYAEMWNKLREKFPAGTVSLLRSGAVSCPVTAGFRRPALLLPATFTENHSPTEFLAAVGHEYAHISRADFAKNLFYETAALLTAFHPVTWFIQSQIAQTREMICDRMAAERLLDGRVYGKSLLQLAAKMPSAAPAVSNAMGIFDANILERRIITVMTSLPHVSRIRRYFFGGAAMLFLCASAGLVGSFTRPVQAQSSNPKKQGTNMDLSCTYYEKGVPSPGTCAADPEDKTKYRCISNAEPAKSQSQVSCKSKVDRAAGKKQ